MTHTSTPAYGDTNARDRHTANGMLGLSVWNNKTYPYSICQLNLGYNPIGNIEVASLLNINNMSSFYLYKLVNDSLSKYNPRIYIGIQTSVADNWNQDPSRPSRWPERLIKQRF